MEAIDLTQDSDEVSKEAQVVLTKRGSISPQVIDLTIDDNGMDASKTLQKRRQPVGRGDLKLNSAIDHRTPQPGGVSRTGSGNRRESVVDILPPKRGVLPMSLPPSQTTGPAPNIDGATQFSEGKQEYGVYRNLGVSTSLEESHVAFSELSGQRFNGAVTSNANLKRYLEGHERSSSPCASDDGRSLKAPIQKPSEIVDYHSPLKKQMETPKGKTMGATCNPIVAGTKNSSLTPQSEANKASQLQADSPAKCMSIADINELLPLNLEAFKLSVEQALKEFRSEHEYYARSRLVNARKFCNTTRTIPTQPESSESNPPKPLSLGSEPQASLQKISPFSSMSSQAHIGAKMPSLATGKLGHYTWKQQNKSHGDSKAYSCHVIRERECSIPPYTNYISTRRNILIEDDKHRTFLPYYGDDAHIDSDSSRLEAKIIENQKKYHQLNALAEMAAPWLERVDDLLTELGCDVTSVLNFLLNEKHADPPSELPEDLSFTWYDRKKNLEHGFYEENDDVQSTNRRRLFNRPRRPQRQWRTALRNLPALPDGRKLASASVACEAFSHITGFSLWHVVKQSCIAVEAATGKQKITRKTEDEGSRSSSDGAPTLGTYTQLVCLICKAHECPGHGEFADGLDDAKNVRIRVNPNSNSPALLDRVYSDATQITEIADLSREADSFIGMNKDKTISGEPWVQFNDNEAAFADDQVCSDYCFWMKENRKPLTTTWSPPEVELLNMFRVGYMNDRRGPCALATSGIFNKNCFEIFSKLLESVEKDNPSGRRTKIPARAKPTNRKTYRYWLENSKTWKLDKRQPFQPCNHAGPCDGNPNCDCWDQEITCETGCKCSAGCSRKFHGCCCVARGKVCWGNEECDCFKLNRECNPDLCRSCGAHDVLDPVNRHNEESARGKCANVYVQRGVPKRTLLGHSRLMARGGKSGWGLYAGERCKKEDYIGEYVGEVLSREEAEQRGTIYDKRNLSYLFDLNECQTLDSTLVGNKLRYINHQAEEYANCYAKTLFCNGVQRIGMFASREIAIGEEILFDYGEDFASKFDLVRLHKDGQVTIEKSKEHPKTIKAGKHTAVKGRMSRPKLPQHRTDNVSFTFGGATLLGHGDDSSALRADLSQRSRKRRRSEPTFSSDGAMDVEMADASGRTLYTDSSNSDTFQDYDQDDDDDDDEEEEERRNDEEKKTDVKPNRPLRSGESHSDRMRRAWITRYANMNKTRESAEQAQKVAARRSVAKTARKTGS